jgi:hypothetical protein
MPPTTKKQQLAETQTESPAAFTGNAVGTFKNTANGEWYIVTIPFDPILKVAGTPVVTPTNSPDRGIAQETFKIQVGHEVEAFAFN